MAKLECLANSVRTMRLRLAEMGNQMYRVGSD